MCAPAPIQPTVWLYRPSVLYTDHWSVYGRPVDGNAALNRSEQSRMRTRMFARVLGPYFLFVPATIAARWSYMQTLFAEFGANPMWPWLYGAILLIWPGHHRLSPVLARRRGNLRVALGLVPRRARGASDGRSEDLRFGRQRLDWPSCVGGGTRVLRRPGPRRAVPDLHRLATRINHRPRRPRWRPCHG